MGGLAAMLLALDTRQQQGISGWIFGAEFWDYCDDALGALGSIGGIAGALDEKRALQTLFYSCYARPGALFLCWDRSGWIPFCNDK